MLRAAFLRFFSSSPGGLVEGLSLGILQSAGLQRWLPSFSRRRWIIATTLVAGIGWAGAAAPARFGGPTEPMEPPVLVVAAGVLLPGALLGAVLGFGQAGGLRRNVRHPWRWI
jgi:hypothetical protein